MAFSADKLRQGAAGDAEYSIDKSLRFNNDSSSYLSRTPASAGNRKTWTWSGWVKLGSNASDDAIFGNYVSSGVGACVIFLKSDGSFAVHDWHDWQVKTAAVHRDPSAWYHLLVAMDTTQSTEANRTKIYVNGIQQTLTENTGSAGTWAGYPPLNEDTTMNSTNAHAIGAFHDNSTFNYFDGYLAEMHFIDGHAVNPDTFGEFNKYGQWVAKTPTFANPSFDDGSPSNHKITVHGDVKPTVGKYG